jgi:hypothetical protein
MTLRLPMLSADDKLAEIRRLYFETTPQRIQADLARALELLKSMASEDERERAAVYMEGLAQMRSDWARRRRAHTRGGAGARPEKRRR